MTDSEVSRIREELLQLYPGAHVKVTPDRGEIVAEIEPGRAVAVIERSLPHFHRQMTESYRGIRGTLYVDCGGRGYVLGPGDALTIEPGSVHSARSAGEPAWIDVLSEPDWTPEDHLILSGAPVIDTRGPVSTTRIDALLAEAAHQKLVARVNALLEQIGARGERPAPLSQQAQQRLGELSNALPYLPRLKNAEINVAQAELAVRVLLSANPQEELATAIVGDLVRRKGVYESAFQSIGHGRTPATFVLLGVVTHAVILVPAVLGLSRVFPSAEGAGSLSWEPLAVAGAVGGATSLLTRLNELAALSRWSSEGDPRQLFYTGLLKPVVGIVAGLFAYAAFSSGLITVHVPGPNASPAVFYAALAFLAGFSERFASDLTESAFPLGGERRS